jgi:hypothetical protein
MSSLQIDGLLDQEAETSDVQAHDAQKQKEIKAFVREYNAYAKKSAENFLGLARTIMRVEGELGGLYRAAFYAEVGLDHDLSKLAKLKKIGENLTRFQPYLERLPNSWTTLYELARLDDEDFKKVEGSGMMHPLATMKEIDAALGRSAAKGTPQFRIYVDLSSIGSRSRQAEFVQKLHALAKDFDLKPVAPSHEDDLSSLLDEPTDTKSAA